ncbi:AraC family transcriptional regulator [Bacterioplanes sanyensis]|uniref:AraC family transcriptional regulator n=2 Tax=Bacterioplanes sanyensis TaxID=1249553 RepID=A0A222FP54_9GAMM|nr:AraC family transcriptional regulator [Bacterioplanes sanyensis]
MAGAAALMGLCLSGVLLMATLHWMVAHRHTRLTVAWLLGAAALAVLQSLEFLYHATEAYHQWPFFLKLVDPLVVLLPLCLYGYIRALLGDDIFASRRNKLLHISPALMVALLAVPYWSLPGAEKVYWMEQVLIEEHRWQLITPFGNYYLAIIAVLSLIYWARQRRQGCLARSPRLQQWVQQLQRMQLIIAVSLLARIGFSAVSDIYISTVYALAPGCAYLLYIVLVRAQIPSPRPEVTTHIQSPNTAAPAPDRESPGNDETALALDDHQQQFQQLQRVLAEGAFRDNQLSLATLAGRCGLSTHQASAAINQCHGNNFYDLVNELRIEAAQQLLLTSDDTVANICYGVGFNSKSTFNTAFRRITGCTPTQFRKRHAHTP